MHAVELCGQPYEHNGDMRDCRLAHNHDGTCTEANHQATLDSPRTRDAHNREPWL